MEIKFCGGAQTVTGSQFLLRLKGRQVLLECGLFQGRRQEAFEKNQAFAFEPGSLDSVVLSHAHMDHSGNLPSLVKKGFRGRIYATPATIDLCQILLRDSAYLQEKDLEWVNRIRKKQNLPPARALYDMADVEACFSHFTPVPYDTAFKLMPGVEVILHDAGHILGAASVLLEIGEHGSTFRLGFTGDIGRSGMPVIRDPNVLRDVDALMIETTYGNRHHSPLTDVEEELAQAVREISRIGGKIIIPSFAVGRTQLVVYILHKLFDQGRIPEIPIFVDSPMAVEATEIFRHYPDLMDRETQRIFLANHEDPFSFGRLQYIRSVEESKELNHLTFPHIIISASGMAEGGRILHHLANNVHQPSTLVLFVGYAAKDTLARKMMDGEKKVRIFGEEHEVRCRIRVMDAFSAHADRADLLKYVRFTPPERLKNIFLVHGEPDQALSLCDAIRSSGYGNVFYPEQHSAFTI
jgi:metallo-beta-lactamase family protein